MSRPLALLLGAAFALLAAAPLAAAQYYKWVDEDGVTHYSQQPPPDSAKIEADAATLPASSPEAPPGGEANGETGQNEGDEASEDGEAGDDGPKTVAAFCERMREEEEKLASDRPVRTKQTDGSLKPLEGEARQQRLEQVRGQIEEHCQGEDDSNAG